MKTPTARTMEECRARGWKVFPAEYFDRWGKRHDLCGFIDVVALTGEAILGIQATTMPNQAARIKKITQEHEDTLWWWKKSKGRVSVWGWYKYKKPVNGKYWRVTETEL